VKLRIVLGNVLGREVADVDVAGGRARAGGAAAVGVEQPDAAARPLGLGRHAHRGRRRVRANLEDAAAAANERQLVEL
jgi:hypothetical protein